MAPSKDSAGLSPALMKRYASAITRFATTSNALMSGTPTTLKTIGATRVGDPTAKPTSSGFRSITDDSFLERLAAVAVRPRDPNGPPLDLYRTETGEHGEIYIATNEYREWFLRTYPRAGGRSEVTRAAPGGQVERPRGAPTLKSIDF